MLRIGLGCVNLGSSTGPSARAGARLIHAALDAGITLFDTADAYGAGASERILGRALRGHRDEVEIATKGGYCFAPRSMVEQRVRRMAAPARAGIHRVRAAAARDRRPRQATGPHSASASTYQSQDFSLTHLRAALEQSLDRLGTDRVDVYQLHGPGRADPELLEVVSRLADSGMVRRMGVGAEDVASAADWVVASAREPAVSLDVVQLPFGPLDPEASEVVFPAANTAGVEVWARGAFGGGVFQLMQREPLTLSDADRIKATSVAKVADELGLDVFELAVAFVRSFPDVSTVVLGTSSVRHLARNVELVRRSEPLPDEVVRRIASACTVADPLESAEAHVGTRRSASDDHVPRSDSSGSGGPG